MASRRPLSSRKGANPTKAQVEAARAAGVSQGELSTIIGKRRRSPLAVRQAIDAAIRKAGGTHAPQMQEFGGRRRRRK